MFALASGRVFPAPFAVPKWLKFVFGMLLLPLCAGAVPALFKVVSESGRATEVWVPLGAGAACWLVVFALLPKPMWIYVVGHELTHVVWSWLFGGSVKKFRASSEGGEVVVDRGGRGELDGRGDLAHGRRIAACPDRPGDVVHDPLPAQGVVLRHLHLLARHGTERLFDCQADVRAAAGRLRGPLARLPVPCPRAPPSVSVCRR